MRLIRRHAKAIAAFLALTMTQNLLLPTVSMALTSGPVAPEYTSFEPVDTSDLVNLPTGDFAYTVPLIEVPGPSGGYPLSLSYHAGIQTNQESSWTGLGWTVNAGAINRTVSGYADDTRSFRRVVDEWEGGNTRYYGVGLGYGGSYVKLTYAEDTYKGSGVGFSVGHTFSILQTGKMGASASVSYDYGLYGGESVGLNFGVGIPLAGKGGAASGYSLGASAGLSLSSDGSVSSGGGIGLSSQGRSVLGASIANNQSPSISVAGASISQVNRTAGRVTTESTGFSAMVPTPVGDLHLQFQNVRYYSSEESAVTAIGALHAADGLNAEDNSFDSYPVFDHRHSLNDKTETHSVGSFPAYDNYMVTAQGLGGSIEPYIMDFGPLYRQNDNDVEYHVLEKTFSKKVNFRMKNSFSGYYLHQRPEVDYSGHDDSFVLHGFDESETTDFPTGGTNDPQDQVTGSNHIQWFTNAEIASGTAGQRGFIDCAAPLNRDQFYNGRDIASQIGGFRITNPSGVTYHYALPVYAYDEYNRSELTDESNGLVSRDSENLHPYAYTWLLTGVTGPDYVDRGPSGAAGDGILNEHDWGYWVTFDYEKYLQDYKWRNPGIGTHADIDQGVRVVSWGKKEIYYLRSVQTASHVAVFDRSDRIDGREVANGLNGGFTQEVTETDYDCVSECEDACRDDQVCLHQCGESCSNTYLTATRPLQKLDKIRLFKAEDFRQNQLETANVLRAIKFNYTYDLAKGTLNSIPPDKLSERSGKLTLVSLQTLGKEEISPVPPTRFKYGFNPDYNKDAADIWGFYKADIPEEITDDNLDRITSDYSKDYVDAWSLSEIVTSTGAEIHVEYESDSYQSSDFFKYNIFRVKDIKVEDESSGLVSIWFDQNYYANLKKFFEQAESPGFNIKILYAQPVKKFKKKILSVCNWEEIDAYVTYETLSADDREAIEVFDDHITSYIPSIAEELATIEFEGCNLPQGGPCPDDATCKNYTKIFVGGLVSTGGSYDYVGGGLRVASVSVLDQVRQSKSMTYYDYSQPGGARTSGVTSYEPYGIGYYQFHKPSDSEFSFNNISEGIIMFREMLTEERKLLQYSREIPSPGVFYEFVTVRDAVTDLANTVTREQPLYTSYHFGVYQHGQSVTLSAPRPIILDGGPKNYYKTTVDVHDRTSGIGRIKSVSTYGTDNQESDNLIGKISYSYLDDYPSSDLAVQNIGAQGRFQQCFYELKTLRSGHYADDSFSNEPKLLMLSSRTEYSNATIGTVTENFKTGTKRIEKNLGFDMFTGSPTLVYTDDGRFKQVVKTIPAYRIPGEPEAERVIWPETNAYPQMAPGRKNMLVQEGAGFVFRVSDQYDPSTEDFSDHVTGLVGASFQSWSDGILVRDAANTVSASLQHGILRKQSNFSFIGNATVSQNADGTYPVDVDSFTDFTVDQNGENGPDLSAGWQKTSSITLYDVNSHALEASDINGNFAATKMDSRQERVLVTVANARYNEFAFSGAEDERDGVFGGGVIVGDGIAVATSAHTGQYALELTSGEKGFKFDPAEQPGRRYLVSAWTNNPSGLIYYNGGTFAVDEAKRAGDWYQITGVITLQPGETLTEVGCQNPSQQTMLFDDFRFQPLDAASTAYVYNQWGELSEILDNNNLFTRYEYDAMGRLKSVHKETFQYGVKKVSETKIRYKGAN